MIYFDNAATTYPKPKEVYDALDYANRHYAFNAGRATYQASESTHKMIEETRQLLADLSGVKKASVVFTDSATSALNTIISGIDFVDGDNVYVSPFEHNAIIRPLYALKERIKINIIVIPFDEDTWDLKTDEFINLLAMNNPKAVFISQVSNVTGYILPYTTIFELTFKYGATNVLDAAQSFGIINNPKDTKVDYIVYAGHKSLYASFGVAGFIKFTNKPLSITKSGGTGSDTLNLKISNEMPLKFEPGSSNSVAISGLNASLKWLKNVNVFEKKSLLTCYLIELLKKISNIKLFIPSSYENKVIGVVSFSVNDYSSTDVAQILSEEFNICVRAGYHCAPLIHDLIRSKDSDGTVRVSVGYFNTKEEIDILIKALNSL